MSLKPYGQHEGDGVVQLTFTLPLPCNKQAEQAAQEYAIRLGLKNVQVTWMEASGPQYTSFILYGESDITIDPKTLPDDTKINSAVAYEPKEIDRLIDQRIGRRLQIVTYSTGRSELAISFEALLTITGVAGQRGLEGYHAFQVYREHRELSAKELVQLISEKKAQVLFVCEPPEGLYQQIKENKGLSDALLTMEWIPSSEKTETSSDYDKTFAPGSKPSDVVSFIVDQLASQVIDNEDEKVEAEASEIQKEALDAECEEPSDSHDSQESTVVDDEIEELTIDTDCINLNQEDL